MTHEWPYPGARWWKFDFHTHTPASKDTDAWRKAIGTPDEVTPEKWLLKYMAAEVDCVAVTDHNSGEWIDGLKSTYARMTVDAEAGVAPVGFRELHIFPGVEISVQGGFHLLAIFDPSASSQTVSDLLAVVRYEGTRGDSDGVTREGAAKVVEEVLAAGGVAIPAHVDSDKGLLRVEPGTLRCQLDATTVKQVLREPGILAVEWCDRDHQPPAILSELKLSFAQVVGSDCHSFHGAAVPGSRYTWIKMAEPSLEGLRLALLDGQQGVSVRRSDDGNGFAPFDKPEHFIESIEIHDARFMGRRKPAILAFNPYFNALIGGRGTGKSTVVHALRLAYRREQELAPGSEAGQTFARFDKAAKNRNDEGGLLPETQLRLQVNRDGTPYRLIWRQDGQGHAVEEWNESVKTFRPAGSQLINEQRFPIRLFSQGQIAALAGDSQQSLLKVIDDAAGTSAQRATLDEARRGFFATCAQMRELDGKLSGRDALNLSLQDVQRKLARFENADHAAVLRNYQRTSRQTRELERQFQNATDLASRLKNFSQELLAEDLPAQLFDATADEPALRVVQKLQAAITVARTEAEQTAMQLDEQSRTFEAELQASPWAMQAAGAASAYDKLKTDLQQQGVNYLSEYGRLVQDKQGLEVEIKRLDALQKQSDALEEKVQIQRLEVESARQAISARRESFLKTSLDGNPYVRMVLIPYSHDAHAIERSLRDLLGAVDGKYTDDLYQEAQDKAPPKGLVADLMRSTELAAQSGESNTSAFEAAIQILKKRLVDACQGLGNFGNWFNRYLKAEADKRPEFIDHILCWFPEDGLQVEYSRKGDGREFQSIRQASAGQRAAAMLAFLLAHGGEPLVLDQPEDDLDNHLIYDLVVRQIRSNKLRRQLIIVTHNPNIVVNGDAELIHVLDFNSQCFIKQTGSLQDKSMRDEVCQVMEGGEEAFERRYQRLGRRSEMFDNAADLLEKIRLGEDSFLELKEVRFSGQKLTAPHRDSLADELAAFANSRGGVCLLGVDDTREVLGVPLERLDLVEDFVRQLCVDCINPQLAPVIERLTLPGNTGEQLPVLRIDVSSSLFVHRSPGGYLHRVGSAKREMPPDFLARLFQQRSQARIIRFDEQPVPGALLDDLTAQLWQRFASTRVQDSREVLLDKLAMARTDADGAVRPTVAGILMASEDPRRWLPNAFIQAVAYRGAQVRPQGDKTYQLDAQDIELVRSMRRYWQPVTS